MMICNLEDYFPFPGIYSGSMLIFRGVFFVWKESKFNFAKPARDLDTMLEKMGAQRMMPTGFGDDQDIMRWVGSIGEVRFVQHFFVPHSW